jgi:hypothetical protein
MHVKPWLVYVLIGFLGVAPLMTAMLASAVAQCAKCKLSEAGVGPCVIAGKDVGNLLYAMFVSGWLLLITFPGALLAALGYSVYLLVRR